MNVSRKLVKPQDITKYGVKEIARSIKIQEEILRKRLTRDSSKINNFSNDQILILTTAAKSMLDFAENTKA
tara:strand:+ start:1033 stop:1245 length:213 start_codon:yes stop_codon:yes gene_type:complete